MGNPVVEQPAEAGVPDGTPVSEEVLASDAEGQNGASNGAVKEEQVAVEAGEEGSDSETEATPEDGAKKKKKKKKKKSKGVVVEMSTGTGVDCI